MKKITAFILSVAMMAVMGITAIAETSDNA